MARAVGLGSYEEMPVLDKDWYECEIDKSEIAETRNGDPMLKWEMHVVDGPDQHDGQSPLDRKLFAQFPHPSPSHKDRGRMAGKQLQDALEAAGVEWDADGNYDESVAVGARVQVKVGHRQYEGETQEEVKKVRPVV